MAKIKVKFDFFKQIEADYGIKKVGDREFEVVLDRIKYHGSLASIFEILRSTKKPGGSE